MENDNNVLYIDPMDNEIDMDRELFLKATADFLRKIRDVDVVDAFKNNGAVDNDNFLRFFSAYLTLNRMVSEVDFQKVIELYEQSEYMKLIKK